MKTIQPIFRFYHFPLFIVELIGDHYRSFSITIRFKDTPSTDFITRFLKNKPPFLHKSKFIIEGREVTVTVGKIISQMVREDLATMKANAKKKGRDKPASEEDPFDYIFYIPGFTSREKFNNDLENWLNMLHRKWPIQFVIRDETDLTRSRYPGAEWC